jgi:energy-coupling factor transporter ATP-binding protein EcfA2
MTATAELAKEPLYLQSLQVENHLRIKFCRIDAKGRSVIISGKNGSGKSSIVNSFLNCVCGPDSKRAPEPVHNGAKESRTVADFGDLKIERIVALNEKTGKYVTKKLQVTPSGGGKVNRPQELLDSMFDKCGRDPVKFLESRNQDQVDAVLGRAGVAVPVDKVKKLTGENQLPHDGESADAYLLRLSADETGLYYVQRRMANKKWEESQGALADQERHLSSLGGRPRDKDCEISAADSVRKIGELQNLQQHRRDEQYRASTDAAKVAEMEGKLREINVTIDELDKEQRELEKKLKECQDKRQATEQRRAKGQVVIEAARKLAAESKAAAESLLDNQPQINVLQANMEMIEVNNKKLRERIDAAKQVERIAAGNATAEKEYKRLDVILEGLREIRLHLLDGVDIGVPGLVIGEGGLRLDGVPFVQASMAQRIRVAAAISMDPRSRIKVMPIDELERLDETSLRLLLQLAKDNPQGRWEILGTRVSSGKADDGLMIEFTEDEDNAPA